MRFIRWLVPAVLPLCAGGCALPVGVVIASYAADGVSYVATGKSVTDHGLSAAAGHDCALLRPILHRKPICDTAPTEQGKQVVVEEGHNSVPRPGTTAATLASSPGAKDRYVAVGSFLSADNAALAKARYAGMKVAVVTVDVSGRQFHRVVIGPLSPTQVAALKARPGRG